MAVMVYEPPITRKMLTDERLSPSAVDLLYADRRLISAIRPFGHDVRQMLISISVMLAGCSTRELVKSLLFLRRRFAPHRIEPICWRGDGHSPRAAARCAWRRHAGDDAMIFGQASLILTTPANRRFSNIAGVTRACDLYLPDGDRLRVIRSAQHAPAVIA